MKEAQWKIILDLETSSGKVPDCNQLNRPGLPLPSEMETPMAGQSPDRALSKRHHWCLIKLNTCIMYTNKWYNIE